MLKERDGPAAVERNYIHRKVCFGHQTTKAWIFWVWTQACTIVLGVNKAQVQPQCGAVHIFALFVIGTCPITQTWLSLTQSEVVNMLSWKSVHHHNYQTGLVNKNEVCVEFSKKIPGSRSRGFSHGCFPTYTFPFFQSKGSKMWSGDYVVIFIGRLRRWNIQNILSFFMCLPPTVNNRLYYWRSTTTAKQCKQRWRRMYLNGEISHYFWLCDQPTDSRRVINIHPCSFLEISAQRFDVPALVPPVRMFHHIWA